AVEQAASGVPTPNTLTLLNGAQNDLFGHALAAIRDPVDGYSHLVVGAPGRDGGVVTVYGRASQSNGAVVVRTLLPVSPGSFGAALAVADLDRDGLEDLIVAAPDGDDGPSDAGAGLVFVYRGVRDGGVVDLTAQQLVPGSASPTDAHFG